MVKKSLLIILFLSMLGLAGCANEPTKIDSIKFNGTIEEIYDNSLIVRTNDEKLSFDKASVSYKGEDLDFKPKIGDMVEIEILPEIRESYPVQTTSVSIMKLEEKVDDINYEDTQIANPWTDVNNISEIFNQLGAEFIINQPEGFEEIYMAKGTEGMVEDKTIAKCGKIIYKNGNKEIVVQIEKDLYMYKFAKENHQKISINSIKAFYDQETKRIIYAQGDYSILIDTVGFGEDFSLVGMVKLK